jgi:hypothetical protein
MAMPYWDEIHLPVSRPVANRHDQRRRHAMKQKFSGHHSAQSTKVTVIRRAVVCDENVGEILGVTAFEQHPQINQGDVISVMFFNNKDLKISGTVTIWHNRNHAAIKTYSVSISGEWIESLKLIVSDDLDDGWTVKGELVTGRLAMDTNGVQGIYSCGEFYRQNHCLLPVAI